MHSDVMQIRLDTPVAASLCAIILVKLESGTWLINKALKAWE